MSLGREEFRVGVMAGADPEELVLRRRHLSPTPFLQEEVSRRRSSDAVRSPSVPRAIEAPRLCTEPFSTVYFTQQPSRSSRTMSRQGTEPHRCTGNARAADPLRQGSATALRARGINRARSRAKSSWRVGPVRSTQTTTTLRTALPPSQSDPATSGATDASQHIPNFTSC